MLLGKRKLHLSSGGWGCDGPVMPKFHSLCGKKPADVCGDLLWETWELIAIFLGRICSYGKAKFRKMGLKEHVEYEHSDRFCVFCNDGKSCVFQWWMLPFFDFLLIACFWL